MARRPRWSALCEQRGDARRKRDTRSSWGDPILDAWDRLQEVGHRDLVHEDLGRDGLQEAGRGGGHDRSGDHRLLAHDRNRNQDRDQRAEDQDGDRDHALHPMEDHGEVRDQIWHQDRDRDQRAEDRGVGRDHDLRVEDRGDGRDHDLRAEVRGVGRVHDLRVGDRGDGRDHDLRVEDQDDGRDHDLRVEDRDDGRDHDLRAEDRGDGRDHDLRVEDQDDGRDHDLRVGDRDDDRDPGVRLVHDVNYAHGASLVHDGVPCPGHRCRRDGEHGDFHHHVCHVWLLTCGLSFRRSLFCRGLSSFHLHGEQRWFPTDRRRLRRQVRSQAGRKPVRLRPLRRAREGRTSSFS